VDSDEKGSYEQKDMNTDYSFLNGQKWLNSNIYGTFTTIAHIEKTGI